MTAQDTWIWQMHADVSLEDQSHEAFWQQLLRWVVDGAPDAVLEHLGGAVPDNDVAVAPQPVDNGLVHLVDGEVVVAVHPFFGFVEEL